MQVIPSQVEDVIRGHDCLWSVPSASDGILTVFPSKLCHTDIQIMVFLPTIWLIVFQKLVK